MLAITCCKDCKPPERHFNCHEHCEKYKAQVEENKKKKAFMDSHNPPRITNYDFDKCIFRSIKRR